MKAIGFNAGQFGDLVMGSVAARAHKIKHPDSKLVLGMARKYHDVLDLFKHHKDFDDIHIWEGYDDWPNKIDKQHLEREKYDLVYNAMPQHTEQFWYLHRHQTEELCLMHDLTPPSDLQINLNKNALDVKKYKTSGRVALSLFGETRGGEKSPTVKQAIKISDMLIEKGYLPIQIGLPKEPQITPVRYVGSFTNTVKLMLECDFLITVDTAMSWIASGYSHPTIGLYGYEYYPLAKSAKNWQPINPNAIYLESPRVEHIMIERIEEAIKLIGK